MEAIVNQYKVGRVSDAIIGKILKLFSSCCDYHCKEILCDVSLLEEYAENLDDSPILYIVYRLIEVFTEEEIQEINLIDHIRVNWRTIDYDAVKDESIYKERDSTIEYILLQFQEKWNVLCSKIDRESYSVKFKEIEEYDCFKNYALELAKPHYVFEGDVLKLLRIKREYGDIIELEPLDSFDIKSTLSKILGLRTDY